MKFDPLQQFVTDQDKEVFLEYRQEYENWRQRTSEVVREMHAAKFAGDDNRYKELLGRTNTLAEEFNEGAGAKFEACFNGIEQRYFDSFAGDKAAILVEIQDAVNAIERKDFLEYLNKLKEAGEPILEKKPGPDSPFTKEEYNNWKKITTRNWTNCVYYLRTQTRLQFRALKFYKFDTAEAVAILEAKASTFYEKPDKVPTEAEAAAEAADINERYRHYLKVQQHAIGNGVAKASLSKDSENIVIGQIYDERDDEWLDCITSEKNNLDISLTRFKDIAGLQQSTQQLMDIISARFIDSSKKSPYVTFTVDEYMKLRNLKDRKSAIEQLDKDCTTLMNIMISSKGNKKGDPGFDKFHIFDRAKVENGIVLVAYGTTFFSYASQYGYMPYPQQLLTLNSRKSKHAYYLLRKITEHKNMNFGKPNENRISVKALLEACPEMPTYEQVMKTGKHVSQRIIEPFEHAMNLCKETFEWEYCKHNGEPLTDKEAELPDYKTFISLMVEIKWKDYPEQTRRAKRIAAPEGKAKKPGRKKGTSD